MTDCGGMQTLMLRAVDDTLDAAGRDALSAHVAECDACRRMLATQHAIRRALADLPMASVSADFAARVRERVSARWVDAFNWRVWTLRLAPVAALLMLLALLPAEGLFSGDGTGETSTTLSGVLDSWTASQVGVSASQGTGATGADAGASHMQLLLNPDADPHALLAAALGESTR